MAPLWRCRAAMAVGFLRQDFFETEEWDYD
jgi:hypothetical protein